MDMVPDIMKYAAIKQAMDELDNGNVVVNGMELAACKCYHYSLNPVHVLFNDNCPESLKQRIKEIFERNEVQLPMA